MGGGTTLVEACSLGRQAVGTDVSSLATFTAKVKTTPLSEDDFKRINDWARGSEERLNLRNPPVIATEWIEQGYQNNISGKNTWPIRKTLELALTSLEELSSKKQQNFVRCALLGTAQWALDSRKEIPSAKEFRKRFLAHLASMQQGAREFSAALEGSLHCPLKVTCLNRSGNLSEPICYRDRRRSPSSGQSTQFGPDLASVSRCPRYISSLAGARS